MQPNINLCLLRKRYEGKQAELTWVSTLIVSTIINRESIPSMFGVKATSKKIKGLGENRIHYLSVLQ